MLPKLMDNQRLKLLIIPDNAILTLFDRVNPWQFIRRPYFALPEGTSVKKAFHSDERSAFVFVLHNLVWDAVPFNEIPPVYMDLLCYELQVPKICDFCKKEIPYGEFCTCNAPKSPLIKDLQQIYEETVLSKGNDEPITITGKLVTEGIGVAVTNFD